MSPNKKKRKVGEAMEKKKSKEKKVIVPPRNPNHRPTNIKSDRINARMLYEDERLIHYIKYGNWR